MDDSDLIYLFRGLKTRETSAAFGIGEMQEHQAVSYERLRTYKDSTFPVD